MRLCACLPSSLADAVMSMPPSKWDKVQEVRLRADAPPVLSTAQGNLVLPQTVTSSQVRECFLRLCGHAVHTHQEELRQGFVTTSDGFRVGVAGTAVLQDGAITSYRDLISLCIRVPRHIDGCAASLLPYVCGENGIRGMLLCGAPGSGKTTLLRDLAQALSVRWNVSVIDERGELAIGTLHACDVLRGCPKAVGILQAVRTLAPDAVIVDEIGGDAEWQAVAHSVFCGVPVIASVHAGCERELLARAEAVKVLRDGGFPYVAFLPPRTRQGDSITVRKAGELFEDHRCDADRPRLHGCGNE